MCSQLFRSEMAPRVFLHLLEVYYSSFTVIFFRFTEPLISLLWKIVWEIDLEKKFPSSYCLTVSHNASLNSVKGAYVYNYMNTWPEDCTLTFRAVSVTCLDSFHNLLLSVFLLKELWTQFCRVVPNFRTERYTGWAGVVAA